MLMEYPTKETMIQKIQRDDMRYPHPSTPIYTIKMKEQIRQNL